jgi:hypothetical protein
VSLIDQSGNALQFAASPGGFLLQTTPPSTVLMFDNFNGPSIDTANRWQAPVVAGSGTLTQAGGNLVTTLGITASNGAAISTIENFEPTIANLSAGALLQVEASPSINTNRCFGFYTRPGSWTAATPVQDGYVWELDITGAFGASIYAGGVRVFRSVIPLSASTFVPLAIAYQGVSAMFYYGSFNVPLATAQLTQPSTLSLPFGFHSINHTSGPAGAPTWQLSGMGVVDGTGALEEVFNGQSYSRPRTVGIFKSLNTVSVAAETTLWTPSAGRKFRLMGFCLTALGAAGNVTLKDNTGGAALPITLPFGAIGASLTVMPPALGNGILSATAGNVLTATGAASQTLSGFLVGTEE